MTSSGGACKRSLPTREAWLLGLTNALRPHFARHEAAIPKTVRVSVGWPSRNGTALRSRRIGECWYTSADGKPQVFISPTLDHPLLVAATLVHELVHATLGSGAGHGPAFRKVAVRVGLAGPMRTTHASAELERLLVKHLITLGPYPHSALGTGRAADAPPKDGARMLKLVCGECGYAVPTTRKWLNVGLPLCPDGDPMEEQP